MAKKPSMEALLQEFNSTTAVEPEPTPAPVTQAAPVKVPAKPAFSLAPPTTPAPVAAPRKTTIWWQGESMQALDNLWFELTRKHGMPRTHGVATKSRILEAAMHIILEKNMVPDLIEWLTKNAPEAANGHNGAAQ